MLQASTTSASDFSPPRLLCTDDRKAFTQHGLAPSPIAQVGTFGFFANDPTTRRHLTDTTADPSLSTSGIQVFGCYDTRGDRLLMIAMLLPDPHEPTATWELAISSIAAELSEALWQSACAHAVQRAMCTGMAVS